MDFVNLFYSISVLVSVFFLCITLNFCLFTALTKKQSESILGPLIDHASSITPFLFAFIIIWPIWLALFWSDRSHVILCILLCWKLVLMTTMLNMQTQITVHYFCLFLHVCWPVTSLYRVIHKSLQNFQTRLRNNQERQGRKEHINR